MDTITHMDPSFYFSFHFFTHMVPSSHLDPCTHLDPSQHPFNW